MSISGWNWKSMAARPKLIGEVWMFFSMGLSKPTIHHEYVNGDINNTLTFFFLSDSIWSESSQWRSCKSYIKVIVNFQMYWILLYAIYFEYVDILLVELNRKWRKKRVFSWQEASCTMSVFLQQINNSISWKGNLLKGNFFPCATTPKFCRQCRKISSLSRNGRVLCPFSR